MILNTFCFLDKVLEVKQNESLTAAYVLHSKEEFLKDHFPGFPVMPGVLLIETVKQAALALLEKSLGVGKEVFRLVRVDNIKFGQFVRPESHLKIAVKLLEKKENVYSFEGRIDLTSPEGAGAGRVLLASFCLEKG